MKVAVKQILRLANAHPLWPTSLDIDRWRDQYHLLHAIPSRHVVRVREFFVGEGPHPPSRQRQSEARFALPFLVMEFVPGPTLQGGRTRWGRPDGAGGRHMRAGRSRHVAALCCTSA
ncbi:MAG: hypothetical protein ACRDRH_16125 [Pseudonocardia sp.]